MVVADIAKEIRMQSEDNGENLLDGETTYTAMPIGLVMKDWEILLIMAETSHVTGITFDNVCSW